MPESPEVKTFANGLRSYLVRSPVFLGPELREIKVLGGRFLKSTPEGLDDFVKAIEMCRGPINVFDVQSYGKFLYIQFDDGTFLANTLGMTGHWGPTQEMHSALELKFIDADQKMLSIYFTDPRRFGTIKFCNVMDVRKKIRELGFDFLNFNPMADPLVLERAKKKIRSSNKTLAELLMDQSVFAGVGNYIKSESLFRARLSPWRIGKSLDEHDLAHLLNAIGYVMSISYGEGGATLATYKHFDGSIGDFGKHLLVYKKNKVHDHDVKREETPDKRTSYWVPTLQV